METSIYEQISGDTLKELFKIWKVRNIEELKNRSSKVSLVSLKFYELSAEAKNIVSYLIKNYDKELSSIDIAYALQYSQKQLPAFFNSVEDIKRSGLLYVKMKRRKLNSSEDTLYFLPEIKDVLESVILRDELKIKSRVSEEYSSVVYKKYLKKIISLYESGCILGKNKLQIDDEDLSILCKAHIFCVYFYGENFDAYIAINNDKVMEKIEKSFDESAASSAFVYNHINILNDIESFLYEADIQRLNADYINVKFLSVNVDSKLIIDICSKLNLIYSDNRGFISLEYDSVKEYLSKDIEEKRDFILKNAYKNYLPYHKEILKTIDSFGTISKAKLFLELKEKLNMEIGAEAYNDMLYYMFLLGFLEASFYENAIIALKSAGKRVCVNKKCFINGNFELTLIDHNSFCNDFIYMCNLYFELHNQENVYTYTMTEDKILKGKTIINDLDSKYGFNNFLNALNEILENNSVSMPKHVETNIRRWYDRGIISSIYENIILINIKDANKMEEIIYEAKRKGMNITKLNGEYGILKANSSSKRNLVKFLRQRRVIVTF